MFIESWINLKDIVLKKCTQIFLFILILTVLISLTDFIKLNSSNKIIELLTPFIYSLILMIALNGSFKLENKNFKVFYIFSIKIKSCMYYLISFLIWSGAVVISKICFFKENSKINLIISIFYLIFIVLKLSFMFFYTLDETKVYNPIKAMVRSFVDTNGKSFEILLFLFLNFLFLIPLSMLKDVLEDIADITFINSMILISTKAILHGILYSIIFIFISIHLSYLYRKITTEKDKNMRI